MRLNKAGNRIDVIKTRNLYLNKEIPTVQYKDSEKRTWHLGKFALLAPDSTQEGGYQATPIVPNHTAQNSISVISNGRGETWIRSKLNLLFYEKTKEIYSIKYNPINHPFLKFLKQDSLDYSISSLLPDSKGNYWFATWDGRLVFFETVTGRSSFFRIPEIAAKHGLISSNSGTMIAVWIFEDSHGTIWAGTNHAGLLRFDFATGTFIPVTARDGSGYSADYNFNFNCITEDREGNLWLGTDKGINIFHPYRRDFQTITADRSDKKGLPDFEITSTLGLQDGGLLVTTWGGGFCIYDSLFQLKSVVQPKGSYEYLMTWDAIQTADGSVWIGAQHGYLYKYQPSSNAWEISQPPETMNSTIRCLTGDSAGNIYLGLNNGHILQWNKWQSRYRRLTVGNNRAPVLSLLVYQHNVWAGTENGLLFVNTNDTTKAERFLPVTRDFPGGVTMLHGVSVLNDSILMAGTKNAGLFFFNLNTKKFLRDPALSSIEQNSVYATQKAKDGSIWLSTDYALYRYIPENKSLSKYTPGEGRINSSFSQPVFRQMASGDWLTSTSRDVVAFRPAALELVDKHPATAVVTGIKVTGRNLSVDSLAQNHELHLEPAENFVTFYFSDLRYNSTKDRRFFYRLSGVDNDWVESGADGTANYTNLSPGRYVFAVKGNDGGNGPLTQWYITVQAPFYFNWWFRILIAVLICSTIVWVIRRRIIGIRRQSILKQRIAEAEVSALRAQMNPHFIFNCLSAIDNMIETDQKEKATTYLNRFARLIRNVLESSKKSLVSLDSDVETLRLYLDLEQFRCDEKFSYKLTADPEVMNGTYKVPPLVVQPFVENAIHHGLLNREEVGGNLQVSITTENNRLIYRVRDNGVGRLLAAQLKEPKEKRHASYGIAITEDRIRMFNGGEIDQPVIITDLYSKGEPAGTLVEVYLKID